MDELGLLRKKVLSSEKRIKELESAVLSKKTFDDDSGKGKVPVPKPVKLVKKSSGPSVSFNQVITILGILGISIGIISFFFYAIARGWIGEVVQVGIGVLIGLILFAVAYTVREKRRDWSNVVFGGAYFIEYLSIGVGVSIYKVIPSEIGIIFSALILISSVVLSVKFSSRTIAYFSLVGGFLIPIITDTFESKIFVMIWYLLILVALSSISVSFNWGDLRVVMLVFVSIFLLSSFVGSSSLQEMGINLLFLASYFILFNVSSLVHTVSHDKEMNVLDSIILGLLPVIFLPLTYVVMKNPSISSFGLIVTLFSFVYLAEAFYLKTVRLNFLNTMYSLFAAGVITLNFGIYFLLKELLELEFFIVFFIIEWALFSYLFSVSKNNFHRIVSSVFLALVAIWYFFILRFDSGIGHASFFLLVLLFIPLISLFYFRSGTSYKINAGIFIVSGYLFLFSLSKYFAFFIESSQFREIILSILWLVYTLTLFVQVERREGKILVGVLLGITLIKVAFRDLLFLDGVFRIVGFILFGILLLVGGYFLENARK